MDPKENLDEEANQDTWKGVNLSCTQRGMHNPPPDRYRHEFQQYNTLNNLSIRQKLIPTNALRSSNSTPA